VSAVDRIRQRIVAVLETADRMGEVAPLHPILERLDEWAAPPTHQPGEPHRYRIECEVCGQTGVIRLSVDPESVPEPPHSPEEGDGG
jgi:hypothetical protein